MRAIAAIFAFLIAGCVFAEKYSLDEFSKDLASRGFNVVSGDPIDQPFMKVQGRLISINGNNIAQVFAYQDKKAAKEIENSVSLDGAIIGKSSVLWKSPPRFYLKANVIIIYTGKDEEAARGIEAIMGKPFAGLIIHNETASLRAGGTSE